MTQIELENKIKEAQDMYSNKTPIMSDIEFDTLWDELKTEYPTSQLLNTVAVDHTDGFKKHRHSIIMGSQNKANTEAEMDKFFANHKKSTGTLKLDGCSIALEYVNGKFTVGATRGDGIQGDDITSNVLKMRGLVKDLNCSFTGTVRGEVLLYRSVKEKYFPEMKNCRNAAAGIMKHLDGADCDKLNIKVYDAQYLDKTQSFGTQHKLLEFLESNGFDVVEHFDVNPSGKEAIETIKHVFSEEESAKRDYDIDGIVYKSIDIDMDDLATEVRPKQMIALKPKFTAVGTILRDIEWNVKNGTVTPVGIFDPVELEGSTVQRASLSNVAMLEELGLEIGHQITVIKANMIIPKIIADNTTNKFVTGYEF